jgi:hypothetical protein
MPITSELDNLKKLDYIGISILSLYGFCGYVIVLLL